MLRTQAAEFLGKHARQQRGQPILQRRRQTVMGAEWQGLSGMLSEGDLNAGIGNAASYEEGEHMGGAEMMSGKGEGKMLLKAVCVLLREKMPLALKAELPGSGRVYSMPFSKLFTVDCSLLFL